MQDFSAADFGSLPLPESICFEDDPGFGLELGLRPCASLEPGDGLCCTAYLGKRTPLPPPPPSPPLFILA